MELLSYPRSGWRKPGSGESNPGLRCRAVLWLSGAGEVGQWGREEDGDPESSQATASSPCRTAGVNIGGAGSYIYDKPQIEGQTAPGPIEHPVKVEERKVNAAPPKGPSKGERQGGQPGIQPDQSHRVWRWGGVEGVCGASSASVCSG